jgi:DNA-binding PadR family transcriptional regulator
MGKHVRVSPAAMTRSLQKLTAPSSREVVQLASKRYRLTDLGSKRIREKLPDKLLLH